jgi:ribosomal protein S18 acetylase RimI-like enzyme
LKRDVIIDWWKDRAADAAEGKRIIIMALAEDGEGQEQLAGYVILYRPLTETGPFRGSVEKLLVSPNFRRRFVNVVGNPRRLGFIMFFAGDWREN